MGLVSAFGIYFTEQLGTLHALRVGGDQQFNLCLFHNALLTLPHLEVLRCLTLLPIPDEVLHHILLSTILLELELGNLPQDFWRCMPLDTPLWLQHFGLNDMVNEHV